MNGLLFEMGLLLGGIALLLLGALLFVENTALLGKKIGVSRWIVGLLVLSVGTSLPELASSLAASLSNATKIVSGNVFGSNIANVFLVLGLPLVFSGFYLGNRSPGKRHKKNKTGQDMVGIHHMLYFLVSMIIVALACLDGVVTRIEAVVLLAAFVGYAYLSLRDERGTTERGEEGHSKLDSRSIYLVFMSVLGLVLLGIGARASVSGLVGLSTLLGVGEGFLGATILAVGTSLPELSVTVVCLLKRRVEMEIGDVVGSNVFNGLVVLGASALVRPVIVDSFLSSWGLLFLLATVPAVSLAERARNLHTLLGLVFMGVYVLFVWPYWSSGLLVS